MNRKRYVIALGLSVILFVCGLIYGMVSVDVKNNFETGIVDISLTEYQLVGEDEMLWEENPAVLPGDVISRIPRIYNSGNDCYVRAKITFRETSNLDLDDLIGMSDLWFLADDGYFYYKEILPQGEAVDIFQALSIPKDYPQSEAGKRVYMDINVDAIQSQNFEPAYDMASPWGNVEILECEKDGMYDVSTFKQSDSQAFQIIYQGEAGELAANADDFFANIPALMPGDTYSDTVTLKNDGDKPISMHFRSFSEDSSDLLDKIQLKISTTIDGKTHVFYEGSMRAAELAEDKILGTLPKNSEGEFTFEIYMPHELNNQYSISSSSVQWVFSTEVIDNPKTGDSSNPMLYLSLMLLSGLALAAFAIYARKDRKEEACE